jgi:hypothetical protein
VNKCLIPFLSILGILLSFSSCNTSCVADPQEFVLFPTKPLESNNVLAPAILELAVPNRYTITTGSGGLFTCATFEPVEVESVTFYNDGIVLGRSDTAPFTLAWQMIPGQNGVPASGTGQLNLYAIDSKGSRTVRDLPLTVTVK